MNLTKIEASALAAKERANKASGMNWKVDELNGDTRVVGKITDDNGKTSNVVIAVMDGYPFMWKHNAEAIAASREDVPALADNIMALVKRVKELEGAMRFEYEVLIVEKNPNFTKEELDQHFPTWLENQIKKSRGWYE